MWRALRRYRNLPPDARRLFQRAVFLLPRIVVSLRIRGFRRTKEALEQKLLSHPPKCGDETNSETVQLTSRVVSAAARYGPLHPTCLAESLVLWFLLTDLGIPSTLRVGVRKASRKFEAHAWVEHAGVALNQRDEPHHHYAAFDGPLTDLPGEQP
jgi:Transglutaminase-like superfamily